MSNVGTIRSAVETWPCLECSVQSCSP